MNNFEKIKETMGDAARDIIVGDLGVQLRGNMITCPFPEHNDKNPSAEWKGDCFHCYGCSDSKTTQYDIFEHYRYHYGIGKAEALQALSNQYNIKLDEAYEPPRLVRKRIVSPDDSYKTQIKAVKKSTDNLIGFLDRIGVSIEVAQSMGVTGDSKEIYFNHLELKENKWIYASTKRRMLDGSKYSDDRKELSISGGAQCFFGLNTLFTATGEYKKYCLLTEGHTDALRVYQALRDDMISDLYAVISLPNGASSTKAGIENSPTFNKWMARKDSLLIMIPDADTAGQFMIKHSREFLEEDKLRYIDICDYGIQFKEKRGDDIGDLFKLDSNTSIEDLISNQKYLQIKECVSMADIPKFDLEIGMNPGFATHFFNDRGFKAGCVTLLSGIRGSGKTSIARQFLYSVVNEGHKAFAWFAESKGEEAQEMTAIYEYTNGGAANMNITTLPNGQTYYTPKEASIKEAGQKISDKITYWNKENQERNAYEKLMDMMIKCAGRDVKFFMLDNLMTIEASSTYKNKWDFQRQVMMDFKEFTIKYKCHILLLAHPNAKNEKVSGAMEVENLADTIIQYQQCDYAFVSSYIAATNTQIDTEDINKVSAILTYSKVRDKGTKSPLFIEWIPEFGALREIAYLDKVVSALPMSKSIFTRATKKGYM